MQARILPITDAQKDAADLWYKRLRDNGVNVEIDTSSDPLSGQIKSAQRDKVPWMLILGKKEAEQDTVTIRHLDGRQEQQLSWHDVLQKITAALT